MILIASSQMNSQSIVDDNLSTVAMLCQDAQAQGVQLLVLPENFACFAQGQQQQTAQQFDALKQRLEQLAFRYGLWLVAGTLPCPYRPNGQPVPNGKVRTVSLCISPEGKTVARYDKIHLFDVDVSDGVGRYRESDTFEAGEEWVVAHTALGKIGLMVCYDLRFPELAITLRKQGADLLTAPSAFTYATGQQHWQLLNRARALDSQCTLIGAAQQGQHGQRQTWGQAMVSQATGKILAQTQETGVQLVVAPFDLEQQQHFRQTMPLMQHRRLF